MTVGQASLAPRSLIAPAPTYGIFWDRLPVVADAATLIGDCLRLARRESEPALPEPLLLQLSRGLPFISLYATETVRREVERRLPEAAGRVPVEAALRAWREHYAPIVKFVDLEPLPTTDPRLARLADVDPDDLPTGSLAELLGPCLVFSSDRHLLNAGIARKDWGALMMHARDVGTFQVGQSGTIMVVLIVGAMGVEVASALAALARWSPAIALVVGGVSGLLVHSWWTSERGSHQRAEFRSVVGEAWSRLMPFVMRVSECQELLERAAFVPEGEPSELAAVARIVAAAPSPPRPSEIGARTGMSIQKVTALLRRSIFTRTTDGRYLLGTPVAAPALPPGPSARA